MSFIFGKRKSILIFWISLLSFRAIGFAPQDNKEFEQARQLERQDKTEEAFIAYLHISDAEYAAADIGRSDPQKFLKILAGQKENLMLFRFFLLQGELWLAQKKNKDALNSFRQAAQNVPPDSYPVYLGPNENREGPISAFTLGPGSQKDNWLIQRFIALGAMDDANKEFQRIWLIHQRQKPFNGLGLRFALDYAYFLKKSQNAADAMNVLLEPLRSLNLEQNPNNNRSSDGYFRASDRQQTTSKKEYIRLAYGFFKNESALGILEKTLSALISSGSNACRKTLAFVLLQEGRQLESFNLELEFVEKASFDPIGAAFRRGLIYEAYAKPREAAGEYERALALPYIAPMLPDKDEEDTSSEIGRMKFYTELCRRLQRLYASLGQTDRILDLAIKRFDLDPRLVENLDILIEVARNFQAAGKESDFKGWLQVSLNSIKNDLAVANIYWLLSDYVKTSQHIAEYFKDDKADANECQAWKERFRSKGKDVLKNLLLELAKANPRDETSRLELLDLDDRLDFETLIKSYESLLYSETPRLFQASKGVFNRTRFRNYYDLAYRLLRLYEKAGRIGELKKFGLRIARAEKPFQNWPEEWKKEKPVFPEGNEFPEDLNLCLSLLVQYADDPTTQSQLQAAFTANPFPAAQRQLQRRMQPRTEPKNPLSFGWANIPAGVSVLASSENILSLAHDDKYIYTGHPWGITVYSMAGKPVTCVALGEAALSLTSQGENLWIGTPIGLYRIARSTWEVNFLACDQDLPPEERKRSDRRYDNAILSLGLDADILWIGTKRHIQAYNTKTHVLNIHSYKEMGLESYGHWSRFIIDDPYVWAEGYYGGFRFDKKMRTWKPVKYNKNSVHIIGLIDGQLWGDVELADPLRHRPCLIDRVSLIVTPLLISGTGKPDHELINWPFAIRGQKNGLVAFNIRNYEYDSSLKQLKQSKESFVDELVSIFGIDCSELYQLTDRMSAFKNDYHRNQMLFHKYPFESSEWWMIKLDNGEYILASTISHHPPYQYYREADEDGRYKDPEEDEGGLFLLNPQQKTMQRLSSGSGDSLAADDAFSAVFDDKGHAWICTDTGLDVLNGNDKKTAHYSKGDGLMANRITSGATLNGKLYFASGWGDLGGALIVYDPHTRVFTALVKSDGLPSEHLHEVAVETDQLRLGFLSVYLRSEGKYLVIPPALLDPKTRIVETTGEPEKVKSYSPGKSKTEISEPLPYLGGYIHKKICRAEKTYLLGSRGLVIVRGQDVPAFSAFTPIPSVLIHSDQQLLLEEAKKTQIIIDTPGDLRRFLKSPNRFVRAEAVSKLVNKNLSSYLDILAGLSPDPDWNVRSSAVYLLAHEKSPRVITTLQSFLNDSNEYIRAMAACGLARHSVLPDIKYFKEILEDPDRYGNLPFGADSTIGVEIDESRLYRVLAPLADVPIFTLLLQYQSSTDVEPEIFARLGKSLRQHPEASQVLLKAYNSSNQRVDPENFSRRVFKEAGKELLPVLHQALASPDRIIRSNAARACGAIADPSSIQPLVRALDLESGLARASIVWALGQLKAIEALPYLAELYVLTRQDDQGRSGFMIAQQNAQLKKEYEAIASLDFLHYPDDQLAFARSLKLSAEEPGRERLLNCENILEAIKGIDITVTREFYRRLAGTSDHDARKEAAVNLGRINPATKDLEKDLQVLRGLCTDPDFNVRMEAAISLLILNAPGAAKLIMQWLGDHVKWEKERLVTALLKVTDRKKLLPFCEAVRQFLADMPEEDGIRREWNDICLDLIKPKTQKK